ELSSEEVRLLNELSSSAKDYLINGVKVTIATASCESYEGDISFLSHKLKEFENSDVVILLFNINSKIHMVLRSRRSSVDVSLIAKRFGGGGHRGAASATLRNKTTEEVIGEVLQVLKENIEPLKTASHIMTSPVKTIEHKCSIKEAEKIMTQYEVNVLPVLKNGRFYGLISREIVEKALFHGFGSTPVSKFSMREVAIAEPSTPVDKIETQMIEKHQRFMPVIENGELKGAITRTDLLRSMYEDMVRHYRLKEYPLRSGGGMTERNLSPAMEEKFPPEILSILKLAGEVAEKLGFSAYLVGGSVRDLLRGEVNLDIDIVIEGDGIVFARELAKELNAKLRCHERFKTATLITDEFKIDIATARTEYYKFPGALPEVEMSSIKKDLYRRDFTINTLAISLNPETYGQLIDFFGGRTDIKEKIIRVLHSMSFIDDPTRALRAVRFAERFRYKISKQTLHLIRIAVEMAVFDKVRDRRLYDELCYIFRDTEPARSMVKLQELGILKAIHPSLRLSEQLRRNLEDTYEALIWFKLSFIGEEVDRADLFFMVLLEGLKEKDRKSLLNRLYVPDSKAHRLIDNVKKTKEALN
ncbi:MAG: CBS domain-containing protein, partial [Nitrospirae bacterium]